MFWGGQRNNIKIICKNSFSSEAVHTPNKIYHYFVFRTSVKERDYDINELQEKLGITNKALKDEQNKCREMEIKIDDLHHQLRDELKRNEKMEKVSHDYQTLN